MSKCINTAREKASDKVLVSASQIWNIFDLEIKKQTYLCTFMDTHSLKENLYLLSLKMIFNRGVTFTEYDCTLRLSLTLIAQVLKTEGNPKIPFA